jgi:sec-independent protein translocase protein TatA
MGPTELIIILVIIVIIFGVGKLPQIGGAVGKGIREFRKGQRDEEEKKEDAPEPMLSDTQKTAEVVDDTEKK